MKDYVPSSSSSGSYNYKPFIKNISIQQVSNDRRKSNQTNNKTFFSNIKAQLNSIRTDVNKLVAKDVPRTLGSANKSYTTSSAQKPDTGIDYSYDRNIEKRGLYQTNDKLNNSNITLQNKITDLTNKLSQQTTKNQQLTQQFQQQRRNQQYLRDQITNLRENLGRADQQINFQNKQIQNCKFIYQKTVQQKQQYAKIIQRLQFQLKKSFGRVQKVIQQDPQLQHKLKQKQATINKLLYDLQKYREENRDLISKLDTMQKDKQIEIAIVSKSYQQKLNRQQAKSFKELGSNFEVKINQLLNQNYNLKNKIVFLQSQLEQQKVKNESLQSTVQAYQSRDRDAGQSVNQKQLQNLRNQVMQLQEQNDKLQSDHQFEIMKLQNKIDEIKQAGKNNNDSKSFNQILKDQINQIQNLKQKLREKNEIINKLKK